MDSLLKAVLDAGGRIAISFEPTIGDYKLEISGPGDTLDTWVVSAPLVSTQPGDAFDQLLCDACDGFLQKFGPKLNLSEMTLSLDAQGIPEDVVPFDIGGLG